MKLSKLLFTEVSKPTKPATVIAWNQDDLAVCQTKEANGYVKFVLYNSTELSKAIESGFGEYYYDVVPVVKRVLAAYLVLRTTVVPPESEDANHWSQCEGAYSVAFSARNPTYPGAGQLLVKLASSILKKPITSDRQGSSSNKAQAMWDRVEDDGDFKRVPLDNWYYTGDPDNEHSEEAIQQYADFSDKDNPEDLDGPKTPTIKDDCYVHQQYSLGSADAWRASITTTAFVQRHKAIGKLLKGKYDATSLRRLENDLMEEGSLLFNRVYRA